MTIVMIESVDFFKELNQNIIKFINPYSLTNNIEEECGSDSREKKDNSSSYYRLNDNFNDEDPKINLDDFSVISQDNYVTLNDLYFLPNDNNDTEELIISTYFIPTTNLGDISVELQEKFKYGFMFSGCKILNNFLSLMTRNQCEIKGIRYVNPTMQKLCSVSKC